MLTLRQLDDVGAAATENIDRVMTDLLNAMAAQIATGDYSATSWPTHRLESAQAMRRYIQTRLNAALGLSEEELIRLFDEAMTRALSYDDDVYRAAGLTPTPLPQNSYMQQIVWAGLRKTLMEYRNLTQTTANTASMQFEDALDKAYHRIMLGSSYQDAIKAGIKDLTVKGLASIRYPSGHVDYMDVAFRRATLTGINQTAAEIQLQRMDEMGTDLVETTAHHGARPDHAVWQGRWFSVSGNHPRYPDFVLETGYGAGEGLCGWNCRHNFFPVIEGLSNHEYRWDKLRELNNRTVTYNGDKMSLYDATQHQRHIERQIRRWKREAGAMDAAKINNGYAEAKVREWQAVQRDFVGQTGLARDYFRERAGAQVVA